SATSHHVDETIHARISSRRSLAPATLEFSPMLCERGPMPGVVITGIGCVTPIGIGVESFTESLKRGGSGIGPLPLLDSSPYACRVSAEVQGFKPQEFMPLRESRSSPRVVQFAVAASRLALIDAGIRRFTDPSRVGVVLGSSVGPTSYNFEQCAVFIER